MIENYAIFWQNTNTNNLHLIWFDSIRYTLIDVFNSNLEYFWKSMCVFLSFFLPEMLWKTFFISYWLNALAAWNWLRTYINLNACVCEMEEQQRQRWKRAWKDQLNKFSSQIELGIRAKNKTRSKSARRAKSKTEQKNGRWVKIWIFCVDKNA